MKVECSDPCWNVALADSLDQIYRQHHCTPVVNAAKLPLHKCLGHHDTITDSFAPLRLGGINMSSETLRMDKEDAVKGINQV
mmetsp:Transcript_65395/g.128917  ORF Transcript_65395/g.128917 Transcript_65395/m.128917 type:complete len:82 (-) Transcript_65395:268-513(-)